MTTISNIQHSNKEIIRRLLREHIKPYRKNLVIAGICMVVVASCTALNALMIRPVLDEIFIEKDRDMLLVIPFAVFFITFIGAAANYINIFFRPC